MKILALDSSSKTASVALLENNRIIGEYFLDAGLNHSETLASMVNSLLNNSNILPEKIDLFAVTNGPGSFTGLRIGIAIIKGMATVLNKPCVGVSSLYATALNYSQKTGIFYVCTDYRNGQLYYAVFKIDKKEISYIISDTAINIQILNQKLKNKDVFLIGNSANICYENLNKKGRNITLLDDISTCIKASNIGMIAFKKDKNCNFSDAQHLNPVYLGLSQAERQFLKIQP